MQLQQSRIYKMIWNLKFEGSVFILTKIKLVYKLLICGVQLDIQFQIKTGPLEL